MSEEPRTNPPQPILASVSDRAFQIGVAAVTVLLVVVLVRLRFCYELHLPDKPPRPNPAAVDLDKVAAELEQNQVAYRGYLQKDAVRFGVTGANLDVMGKKLPYQTHELSRRLDPRKQASKEAAGLRLTAEVRRIEGATRPQLVLRIDNLTDRDLAYHVVTRPSRGTQPCHAKSDLSYDAMVVRAGESVARTECIYKRGWALEVEKVETLALPPLAAYYVSAVPPAVAGIEPRLARGHRPLAGATCRLALSAAERNALERGAITWRDIVDFYARHRCMTYRFPEDYKAFERDGERPLPVAAE